MSKVLIGLKSTEHYTCLYILEMNVHNNYFTISLSHHDPKTFTTSSQVVKEGDNRKSKKIKNHFFQKHNFN